MVSLATVLFTFNQYYTNKIFYTFYPEDIDLYSDQYIWLYKKGVLEFEDYV